MHVCYNKHTGSSRKGITKLVKKRYGKDLVIGIVGGTIIYVIGEFVFLLAYLPMSDDCFSLLYGASMIMGPVISVVTLLYKNSGMITLLIRFFTLFIAYIFFIAAVGNKLFPLLKQLLPLRISSSNDAASGLMLFFLL